MKLRFAAIVLVAAFCSALPSQAAAPTQPTAAMMRPVNALLTALNTQNAAAVRGMFTSDATIVDEFPPFTWGGSSAGDAYLSTFKATMPQMGATNVKGRIDKVIELQTGGNRAYIAFAATVSGMMKGKPFAEHGVWTFVLQQHGAVWLIRSSTWGTSIPA